MSFQPSVVEYFNNRKRPAVEESRKLAPSTKVVVLESQDHEVSNSPSIDKQGVFAKKLVYTNKEAYVLPHKKPKSTVSNKVGQSQYNSTKVKRLLKCDGSQTDIRKTLFKLGQTTHKKIAEEKDNIDETEVEDNKLNVQTAKFLEHDTSSQAVDTINLKLKDEPLSIGSENNDQPSSTPNVSFHIKGALSPAKAKKSLEPFESEKMEKKTLETLPSAVASTSSSRKELNLGNLKAMMSRSSRREELKAALQRFNENKAKLTEIEEKKSLPEKPTLEGFKNIDLQVPASPLKTPVKMGHFTSPQGKLTPSRLFSTPPPPLPPSPLKSPLKSPAFQRYQALVTEGRPALVLPFKYRMLAELFRNIDTVASMLYNRKETITLAKLKPGVQEISRKNLTEYDLGQIKTVYPKAFEFSLEKMRTFGSAEKYELVITPILSEGNKGDTDAIVGRESDGKQVMMGPSMLLARRRVLYNALLELTKQHHEDFLKCLDPPMSIPRSRLTRWHPEFSVDEVPDILSAALPQPPNFERITTAKDVLEKAHDLFVMNPRMARALKKLSENSTTAPILTAPTVLSSTNTKSALHGVPTSILERVRAKQAARAVEAMTRTPAQAKEAVRLTRLPEIARIVRNLFVAEKRSVLTREMVLTKLADSYRESLTRGELDDHLKLLEEKTPGWMTFCNLRKTDYVKLSRNADMSRIMTRLETLAANNCV